MVTMGTVKTLLTFEEFEQLPDQPGKQELVRGELIELPPAEYKHHLVADRIYDGLKAALRQAQSRGEANSAACFGKWATLCPARAGCSRT
jgi:Uma2 family endonuclease